MIYKRNSKHSLSISGMLICLSLLLCQTACGTASDNDYSSNHDKMRFVLNDRQKEILVQMELPTEYDALTASQRLAIQRIESMLTYLEDKYEPSFEYAGYIPAGLTDEEELIAYQKNPDGTIKHMISVKVDNNGDYYDDFETFAVGDYYEGIWNDNFTNEFPNLKYKFIYHPLLCDIELSKIENEHFEWEYAVQNTILLELNEFDLEEFKKIETELTKWYYEHQIHSRTTLRIFTNLSVDINGSNYTDWYHKDIYLGYYEFDFDARYDSIYIDYRNVKGADKVISEKKSIDDYIKKECD